MSVPALGHTPAETPVAVVFGGPSAEHDVSIVSGTAIAEALASSGYPVEQWLIDLEGTWWRLPDAHRRAGRPQAVYDDPAGLGADGPLRAAAALDSLAASDRPPLVFLALHGPFGEDGTVQALCEAAGLAYTGSGVAASAIGMDKAVFKRLARGLGLPVVAWLEVRAERWRADPGAVLASLDAFAGAGDARLMVKPARLGSSLGMTLAHRPQERGAALDEAFRFDDVALVEHYVAGARDLEVSVIGNAPDGLEVYGPGEIMSGHEFYDYQAKYTPGLSLTTQTAEVTAEQRTVVLDLARAVYAAVGCEGFARVDFLLGSDEQVRISEINTIPGFTPISLFPTLPAAGGYTFADVCARVVDLALARAASRVRHRTTTADLPR